MNLYRQTRQILLFSSTQATNFGHYWRSSGIKYMIFKTQNEMRIYRISKISNFTALIGDGPHSLWEGNLILMSILFRKLSYLKDIYQAQYNVRANDCHGTHSQPTCGIIAALENDCPSCLSCSCHRYWLSGPSAAQ